MVEIISLIIFIASIAGIGALVVRKIPVLSKLRNESYEAQIVGAKETVNAWVVAKFQKVPFLRDFSWLDFAQKQLLKGRVVALKADNKINDYIQKLKKKTEEKQKKEEALLDNYWHELKTIVKARNPLNRRNPKTSVVETQALPKNEPVGTAERIRITEVEIHDPMVERVVTPESVEQKEQKSARLRKKHSIKKHKTKDPFQW